LYSGYSNTVVHVVQYSLPRPRLAHRPSSSKIRIPSPLPCCTTTDRLDLRRRRSVIQIKHPLSLHQTFNFHALCNHKIQSKLSSPFRFTISSMAISKQLSLKRPNACLKQTAPVAKAVSPNTSPKSGMQRSVSFQERIQIFKVQPVDSSLKNDLYYGRSDFRRFKKESKQIMQMLDQRLRLGSSFRSKLRPALSSSSSTSDRHRNLSLSSFRLR
jgi:hypothetical protein